MQSRKKWFIFLLLFSLAGANACRPWRHKSPEERANWLVKRISKELELNESQKQALGKIKDEFLAKHRAERPQMQEHVRSLSDLVRAETIDQAKLAELRKKHRAHREAMENFFVEKALEFHKILTPEQRAKAADLLQKHFARMAEDK